MVYKKCILNKEPKNRRELNRLINRLLGGKQKEKKKCVTTE
jgi:hypothetical protein